jgi:hypothetical protein
MPQTILPITVNQTIFICFFVLIVIFIINKINGVKGSWTPRNEIDLFLDHSSSLLIPQSDEINDSEGERICRNFLRDTVGVLFKDKNGIPESFQKARPEFLRNPVTSDGPDRRSGPTLRHGEGGGAGKGGERDRRGGERGSYNLEIDCYSPKLKLGVEYNGIQHYKFTPHFHKNHEAFRNQQYRDELKRRMCNENNVTLIEVPYTVKNKDIPAFLFEKLKPLGYFNASRSSV